MTPIGEKRFVALIEETSLDNDVLIVFLQYDGNTEQLLQLHQGLRRVGGYELQTARLLPETQVDALVKSCPNLFLKAHGKMQLHYSDMQSPLSLTDALHRGGVLNRFDGNDDFGMPVDPLTRLDALKAKKKRVIPDVKGDDELPCAADNEH